MHNLRLMVGLCLALWAGVAGAKAIDFENREISISLSQEPPDLNTLTSTDQVSGLIASHVMEGLLTRDKDESLIPGVAVSWELTQTHARFTLRENAMWSDGQPVTAHDFVFAWRKAVEPETASQYAFILFPIKNAEAINDGEMPSSELGVRAIDDLHLEVELERPTPYFMGLTSFSTYYPIREDIFNKHGDRFAAEADTMIYNGAFTLTEWVHGASLKMEKNPHYWNKEAIYLNAINVPYITSDPNALFNMFLDEDIALTGLSTDVLDNALEERLALNSFLSGSVFFFEFNHRPERVTSNLSLRKAIQAIYDPADMVYKVIGVPGILPTYTLFPSWMQGAKTKFRLEHPPQPWKVDLELAAEYLEKARLELIAELAQLDELTEDQQLRLSELEQGNFPPIALLVGDSPNAVRQAEYVQQLFSKSLGLRVKIDTQTFKQRLQKMTSGEFDIVMAGWGPDYDDLNTFADLFMTKNLNNRGRYSSSEYDELIDKAASTLDQAERMRYFARIQEIIREDVVILPQLESGSVYAVHPAVRGVVRRVLQGDPDYRFVTLVKQDG